ncbi:MAG: FAD-dependent oxidoreductase [Flavobacteriales bacterium]|nr:FAD-dependent oxidoreductase [Flavobacteriales bacterium]
MAEYKKPTTEAEFNANFHPKKPLMTDTEAYYESSRCLYCYDAPCVTACPTGIDIPQFIRQINSGTNEGAAKTIYDSNWMGHACGNVCPTEELCEGACVYNHSDVKPIEIGRLQAHATAEVIRTKKKLFRVGKDTGKKVAVIGAGPAGISAACELRMLGHAVTIYEARALPSGLCVHGVAPYKLTNEEALDEMAYLQEQFGFDVHYNKAIAGRADLEKLEKDFDAIFIGIGLGSTSKLGVIGEDKKGVLGALEYAEGIEDEAPQITYREQGDRAWRRKHSNGCRQRKLPNGCRECYHRLPPWCGRDGCLLVRVRPCEEEWCEGIVQRYTC